MTSREHNLFFYFFTVQNNKSFQYIDHIGNNFMIWLIYAYKKHTL